jgi:tetratricopeptide (TPR) repeat protein
MALTNHPSKFEQKLQEAAVWIRGHQEQFWSIAGTVVLLSLLIFFIIHHREEQNEEAWYQLGALQGQLIQGQQYPTIAKGLDDWQRRYEGTSARSYAQFMKGDLLYKTSDYISASQVYGALAQTASIKDMRPLALSAQQSAEEMAGHLPQARQLAKNFTELYPDHFMAASAYFAQARLAEAMNDIAAASAAYDRFLVLYPQSPWVAAAKSRQQALAASKLSH